MALNRNAGPNGSVAPPNGAAGSEAKKAGGRRRLFTLISIVLLILVVFAGVRISMLTSTTNDQLTIHIANQQDATLDLRQSFANSPYFLGANVFPEQNTSS